MPFPLRESDLHTAEDALGFRFPESFRRKMLTDNGGEVATSWDHFELFRMLDRTDRARLARTSSRDLVRENAEARSWPGFPRNAIAIGNNGGGDYLVFLRESSAVFVWDHETAELTPVAADFAELA